MNKSVIDDVFQSIYATILSVRQTFLGKGSEQIIRSIIDHTINIKSITLQPGAVKQNYQKNQTIRKGLINIQNIDDNECFKWYLVRYVNPADHNPRRITKADKGFTNKT